MDYAYGYHDNSYQGKFHSNFPAISKLQLISELDKHQSFAKIDNNKDQCLVTFHPSTFKALITVPCKKTRP